MKKRVLHRLSPPKLDHILFSTQGLTENEVTEVLSACEEYNNYIELNLNRLFPLRQWLEHTGRENIANKIDIR